MGYVETWPVATERWLVREGDADGYGDSAESPCGCTPRSPSAERYTVMVHVDHDALVHGQPGRVGLDNLVLLCSAHHRGVHEGGFSIRVDRAGIPRFLNRDGVRIPDQPPAPELAPHDPVGTLVRTRRFRGIDPGPGAGLSWPTVPTQIENDFRAALDPP